MSTPNRKVRRDATLKKLRGPQRQQVIEWLEADGPDSCAQRIFSELGIASPKDPSKPISIQTIYEALAFWRVETELVQAFAEMDAQTELMAKFRPGDAKLAREFGEFIFLQAANRTKNDKLFAVATTAADKRRSLDLQENIGQTKARQKDAQIRQKDTDLQLAERRVVLLEDNAKKAKAALEQVKSKGGLSPSTLKQIEEAAALL